MIWRIEHKDSGLGPFQHGKQEVLGTGVCISIDAFPDLERHHVVRDLLQKHKDSVFFGFNDINRCGKVIRDADVMLKHGFIIKAYDKDPIYTHESGHVLFLKE